MGDAPVPSAGGSRPAGPPEGDDPLRALPGLLRFGIRTGVRPGLRATQNFLDGAVTVTGHLADVLLGEGDAREAATAIRGEVVDRTRDSFALPGEAAPPAPAGAPGSTRPRTTAARLRRKGEALLARSADLDVDTDVHPAFDGILDQLAPDEARVLRTLGASGPQPVVDIEARGRFGGDRGVVARNVGRLGPDSGCRHPERIDAYLDNLGRLGLIRSTREEVADDAQYEVLAVQPAAVEAVRRVDGSGAKARVVRRSVALTAFGDEFVEACFG